MELINKFNETILSLLCVNDTFSKYTWIVPLKDKKGITVINASQKFLDESSRKPDKIWVDKISEFYNRSVKITRKNMVWKLVQDYSLCYCQAFSLVLDPTVCKKKFLLRKNAVHYSYSLILNNILDQRKNMEKQYYPWLILFI